jgi:hypothetical protein
MTQPSPPKIMVALDLSDPVLHVQIDKPSNKKFRHPDQLENHDHQIDQHIEQAISLTASLVCDAYFHGYQIGLAVMGVPFTPFPVHHSLPHRTKMLEALSQLDASHRTGGAKHLPSRPSIIIRPRVNKDTPDTAGQGQQIFDAAKIHDYAVDLQDGAGDMLEGRSASRSRRQQVQEERAWG